MICWYCYWGWAEPVAALFIEMVARLGGWYEGLTNGPAHIVWADENFDDGSIAYCLAKCEAPDAREDYSPQQIAACRESLFKLKAIPEHVRCCVPADYDGENPENFPPTVPVRKAS